MERKGWNVLLCAADDADATALTFAKRAIERRDDLSEVVEERARDWHDWFDGREVQSPAVFLVRAGGRCDASK